jgi:hypothetical protein
MRLVQRNGRIVYPEIDQVIRAKDSPSFRTAISRNAMIQKALSSRG